jgi:tryptophan synthase
VNKVSRLLLSLWVRPEPVAQAFFLKLSLTLNHPCLGYFNPLLAHGEERAVKDAKIAGANGFIIVDLPPEEAVEFRKICTSEE